MGFVRFCRDRLAALFNVAMAMIFLDLLSANALAVGGKPATRIVNVADTRGMAPGISKWIADTYNTNLWLYGLTVVLVMAGMGLVLGLGFDRLMALTGINLGRLEHRE